MFGVVKNWRRYCGRDGPVHFGGKSGIPTHSLASICRGGGLCMVDSVVSRGRVVVVKIVEWWSG